MPVRDASWKPGWGWGGNWKQEDLDKEFDKVTNSWQSANDEIDTLVPLVAGLRPRKALPDLRTKTDAVRAVVTSWDRSIAWSERSSAITALTEAKSSVSPLRAEASTFKAEDDAAVKQEAAQQQAKLEKASRHEALMAEQQAAKRARLERAEREERQARETEQARRVADAEERSRLVTEEQARRREEKERRAREDKERRTREEQERRKREEEHARKEKDEREAAGRAAWSTALDEIVATTDPNAARTMPDAFGSKEKQLATLRRLLAADERRLDDAAWAVGEVQALTTGNGLRDRWADHQRALANAPRAAYEERSARMGSPISKLGIDAAKLWTFLGYPEARGRDYAMPQFEKDGTKYHFSLTGNSMHDLSALWKNDPTILTWRPEQIFEALFETGIATRRRIHITRESDGAHVYLGDVTGEGRAIRDHEFGGDALVMKGELKRLKDQFIAKLWDAKKRHWVLT